MYKDNVFIETRNRHAVRPRRGRLCGTARGVFRLSQNSQGDFATVPFRMAGCMFLAIPILILFLIFKEKLMGNLSMGGIKE